MIWLDVIGFEGLYKVSENGDIFSQERNGTKGGLLKQYVDRYGYKKVILRKSDKPHYFTIHRLVAIAFIPNPDNKPQVNHKNSNRQDNKVENLEWCTNKENIYHSHNAGNQRIPKQSVVAINLETGEKIEFESQREAARCLGTTQTNVYRVLKGVYKQTKGFTFIRKEG